MSTRDTTRRVFCIGTADSKLEELRFLSESVRSNLNTFSGTSCSNLEVAIVDVSASLSDSDTTSLNDFAFVSRNELLSNYFGSKHPNLTTTSLPDDRGEAIDVMSKALKNFLTKANENGVVAGAIGLGGSGGTALISPAMRSLPIGIPKLIISTVASGQTQPYVGVSDLVLFPSIVDVCGINSVSRVVMSNASAAFAGMVTVRLQMLRDSRDSNEKFTIGMTMFGVTTQCVNAVKERLVKDGYETLVFHATGVGGKAMESLVKEGFIKVCF